MPRSRYDVVIIGGGHNGLVAAAYLAHAGRRVLVLERLGHVGGLAVSASAFPGVDARLSRYSYLVGLLPTKIVKDLGLGLDLGISSAEAGADRQPLPSLLLGGRPLVFVQSVSGLVHVVSVKHWGFPSRRRR